jgi:TolA-binding protein
MINRLFLAVLLLSALSLFSASGQKSLERDQPERILEEGLFHYERGYYGVARELFGKARDAAPAGQAALKADAAFYEALSASYLENGDAPFLLERYLEDYPESKHLSHTNFRLGELAQDDNRDRIALRWFEKVKPADLDREVRLRYFYKAGYAYFMEDDYVNASRLLANAKDVPSKYWAPANYYYAHIQYEEGNHEAALRTFEKLQDEPGFKSVIPYYIAQIYYMQEDYDQAIAYGTPLMAEAKGVMRSDLARVLGDSYFAQENYSRAIPYLSIVVNESKTPRREDYYHLGLSYYFEKDYVQAATYLAQVTSDEDEMTQNAYYHLADCYLKTGDKKNARIAFEAANRYTFDMAIKEDAMFNYIKLNYELSFSPFNEIVNSFLQFIEEFPNSQHIDAAYQYMGQALLTTKNYRQALEAMERIGHKNAEVYRAMQRVAYLRGLELFTNLQLTESIGLFDYSLKYGAYDNDIKMGALYWRAEAQYRLGNYAEAQKGYLEFLQTPGSRNMDEFLTAHYNMGYVSFKQHNYAEAQKWFTQYVNRSTGATAMMGDAYNRLGDTYFMVRDFTNAMSWYDRAAGVPDGSPDYAMFQKALAQGIGQNQQAKIRQLDKLIQMYPVSPYVDDAWFEMGRSYVHMDMLDDAIRAFKTVRDKYPRSGFASKAMLQLGLVFYNSGDLDQSMVYYKRVVNEFPGTPEAEDALLGLRNVYMDQNDPDGYIRYTNQIGGFARVDDRQRDSLSYVAAERLYMAGNCEQSLIQLENYLRSYPQGRFVLNAHFYKADCQYRAGDMDNALTSFEFVTGRGKSLFSEDALKYAGEIHFRKDNYANALGYFERLEEEADLEENRQEAVIGQMRALSKMTDPTATIAAAGKVMANARMAPEIVREARYVKALAHLGLGQKSEAMTEFRALAENTSSVEGAEAKYRVAQMLYDDQKQSEAEQVIFDFVNKGTPHQYWMARSFILLSDIYADRQEFFQAAQYLESLLENYSGDEEDIKRVAQEKLARYREEG